jgi:hypothetical protein
LKELYPQAGLLVGKPHAGTWRRGDRVHLDLDGTSAIVFELAPQGELKEPLVLNAAAISPAIPATAELKGSALSIRHAAGEPGTERETGVLLPGVSRVSTVTVNGAEQHFTQTGAYVEVKVRFKGERFAQSQEIPVDLAADGSLKGSFTVPKRIFDQLTGRRASWPIAWTKEDYESTWLVPERLLLVVQVSGVTDTMEASALLDGKPLPLKPAYSSARADPCCFVGFYADLSHVATEMRHTIEVRIPQSAQAGLQGLFFDNVEPQFTESLAF